MVAVRKQTHGAEARAGDGVRSAGRDVGLLYGHLQAAAAGEFPGYKLLDTRYLERGNGDIEIGVTNTLASSS